MSFQILRRDGWARICRWDLPHGSIETPTLLPVINPNNMAIPPSQMASDFGVQTLITNSFILNKHEDLRTRALDQGIHEMLEFQKPIMTDSGTFQAYVYGEEKVDPEEIIEFQRDIGVDIGTLLDVFTVPETSFEKAREEMEETLARAARAAELRGDMALAATVQGGVHLDLRTECARRLSELDAQLHPIGGVVPLMEQYRYPELTEVILAAKKGLDPSRPVHLFGAGHPMIFPLAVLLGCDLFDSSAYAKFARNGRMLLPTGTVKLKQLEYPVCTCLECQQFPPAVLKKMDSDDRERIIARHNLRVSMFELDRIKQAIHDGKLWELVESRAATHPQLNAAMKVLHAHRDHFLETEPISRSVGITAARRTSFHRPAFGRLEQRLARMEFPEDQIRISAPGVPWTHHIPSSVLGALGNDATRQVFVEGPLGALPLELDQIYPIAQTVTTSDQEREEEPQEWWSHWFEQPKRDDDAWDRRRLSRVCEYQFGTDVSGALFGDRVEFVRSPNNRKVRNVLSQGRHVLSLRAHDGLFTLKRDGAARIHAMIPAPHHRVVVDADSIPFNRDGRSVFAQFVRSCDPQLRPGDECVVVGPDDELVALGRILLSPREMLSFQTGVAVKVREGFRDEQAGDPEGTS